MKSPLILTTPRDLGLTSYEAKIYPTLLERDTLTAQEISKLAEVSRPSEYEAFDKLMSKGMCISKTGRTKKYSASDPTVLEKRFSAEADRSMETELLQLENSFKEKQKEIIGRNSSLKQNIGKLIKQLLPQYENSREETNPLDYIEIIKDPYQIHERIMQLHAEAKEEILVFTKPPFTGPR
jgi:sugar-specific transcriptional regulator TrmB